MIATRPLRPAARMLLLAALAVAGNYLRFPLFFGVDLVFGSIAVLVAVSRLGTLQGVAVAGIGGVYTLFLWQHPYAMIIFVAEALFVGLLRRRVANLILRDALFWLVLGAPMVIGFYAAIMVLDWPQTLLIALKQPLNGVFNALMASLVMLAWDAWRRPAATFRLSQLFYTGVFGAVLLPALLLIAQENRQLKAEFEAATFNHLRLVGAVLGRQAEDHLIRVGGAGGERALGELEHLASHVPLPRTINWAVVDEGGKALVEHGSLRNLGTGQRKQLDQGVGVWIPLEDGKSSMAAWKDAWYSLERPLLADPRSLKLIVAQAASPIIDKLHWAQVQAMALLLAIAGAATLLAMLINHFLAGPLVRLAGATQRLRTGIHQGEDIQVPGSRLREVNQLAGDFRAMALSLRDSFRELKHLAGHDPLTDVLNRGTLTRLLEEERDRAERYESKFSIMLCDVDNFKLVNDRLGHNVGDKVLIELTRRMAEAIRKPDILGRWGGEEFLLILPETGQRDAVRVAEKIREAVKAWPAAGTCRITVSIGVAEYQSPSSVEKLVDEADQALYRSKREGRDRVSSGCAETVQSVGEPKSPG